jgi:hypothetical protein
VGSACAQEGGGVKAYFEALANENASQVFWAWNRMTHVERGMVSPCFGGIGEKQFGFRAEVGRG